MKLTISFDSKTCRRYADTTVTDAVGSSGPLADSYRSTLLSKQQARQLRMIAECGLLVAVGKDGKLSVRTQPRAYCRRCGSRLVARSSSRGCAANKLCGDATCPYHDHKQDWDYEREAQ